jgi:hypothetical protein
MEQSFYCSVFLTFAYAYMVGVNAQGKNDGIDTSLEISVEEGVSLLETLLIIKKSNIDIDELRGTVEIDGEIITWGVSNQKNESVDELENRFYELLENMEPFQKSGKKNLNEIAAKTKLKLFTVKGPKDEISKAEKNLVLGVEREVQTLDPENKSEVKVKKFDIEERKKWMEEERKQREVLKMKRKLEGIEGRDMKKIIPEILPISPEEKKEIKDIIKKKKEGKEIEELNNLATDDTFLVHTEQRGGVSQGGICDTSATNPYCGDRQDRLKQKARFNEEGDVYSWLPTSLSANTSEFNSETHARNLHAYFSWDSTAISNLVIDDNEAIEMEVLFYNYGSGTGIPENGTAYMSTLPYAWFSNLPDAYLDTRFMDEDTTKSYAIGTASPHLITADIGYYFSAYAYPSSTNTEGLWQINFQRGYWLDSTNFWYRFYRGSGDEWYVFNEENETTAKMKQFHKYDDEHYAPSSFYLYPNVNYENGFRYKEEFSSIDVNESHSTGYISSGGYKVYRFQVNNPGEYIIMTMGCPTSRYGSSDTYLKLYDSNFNVISYNDDADGTLCSQIEHNFEKGDYYVVVRGYNWSSFECLLDIRESSSGVAERIYKHAYKYFYVPFGGEKWYDYYPDHSGYVTIKTEYWYKNGDTYLFLYDTDGNLLGSNDDSNGTLYSEIYSYLRSGHKYRIIVKGYAERAVYGKLLIE